MGALRDGPEADVESRVSLSPPRPDIGERGADQRLEVDAAAEGRPSQAEQQAGGVLRSTAASMARSRRGTAAEAEDDAARETSISASGALPSAPQASSSSTRPSLSSSTRGRRGSQDAREVVGRGSLGAWRKSQGDAQQQPAAAPKRQLRTSRAPSVPAAPPSNGSRCPGHASAEGQTATGGISAWTATEAEVGAGSAGAGDTAVEAPSLEDDAPRSTSDDLRQAALALAQTALPDAGVASLETPSNGELPDFDSGGWQDGCPSRTSILEAAQVLRREAQDLGRAIRLWADQGGEAAQEVRKEGPDLRRAMRALADRGSEGFHTNSTVSTEACGSRASPTVGSSNMSTVQAETSAFHDCRSEGAGHASVELGWVRTASPISFARSRSHAAENAAVATTCDSSGVGRGETPYFPTEPSLFTATVPSVPDAGLAPGADAGAGAGTGGYAAMAAAHDAILEAQRRALEEERKRLEAQLLQAERQQLQAATGPVLPPALAGALFTQPREALRHLAASAAEPAEFRSVSPGPGGYSSVPAPALLSLASARLRAPVGYVRCEPGGAPGAQLQSFPSRSFSGARPSGRSLSPTVAVRRPLSPCAAVATVPGCAAVPPRSVSPMAFWQANLPSPQYYSAPRALSPTPQWQPGLWQVCQSASWAGLPTAGSAALRERPAPPPPLLPAVVAFRR